ncbi:predicted protein [Sclerotinia sclerotiorum 1980 UF-70]|uniref:Uncharacterized protein n=1 Tax=Sclerotinia sclerotiorum (strain ATCC 18683 / 1980 / Ss-1) TaxID=665079 RepID=A7F1L2_SCLS1|nr:predicted protein [Sclerotinia sclerotiorum 1980 UF-70]EDN95604.1 predicted protein [Sclerotinia sclerotiorum 1980 UF-70]
MAGYTAFPNQSTNSSMSSRRQGRLDPREAEAKAELQNPRGQPADKTLPDSNRVKIHMIKKWLSQLDIDKMSVNSQEHFVQDEWAKAQLRKIGNTCPRGCRWIRIDGGYRCGQGFHWATDLMLSDMGY